MDSFIKTIKSLLQGRLIILAVLTGLIALGLILGAVGTITLATSLLVDIQPDWLATLVNIVVAGLTGVGGWFIMPILMTFVAGMFKERVIRLVEQQDYPDVARSESPRFWPDFVHDLRFLVVSIAINLALLPFYLFSIGFILAVLVNSYLIGREYFEGTAGYHLGKPSARVWGKRNRMRVYGTGLAIYLVTLVPIVNLFIPIVGTVWTVHVFHRLRLEGKIKNFANVPLDALPSESPGSETPALVVADPEPPTSA